MKKLLLLPVLMLIFSINTVNASFTDVSTENEFSTYINWLQDQGVVQGYEDGTFGVYKDINRAEFLKMLYETIGGIDTSKFPKQSPFPDVSENIWYYKYVTQAYIDGVVQGYTDGTFKPENNITLAEALKIVEEAFFTEDEMKEGEGCSSLSVYHSCKENSLTENELSCVQIENMHWAFGYFCKDKYLNLSGMSSFIILDKSITRGLMAQLLYRSKAVRDNGFKPFTDSLKPMGLADKEILSYCTSEPESTDIGYMIYPKSEKYSHLSKLGELFTASECSEERMSGVFGVDGSTYILGSDISLTQGPSDEFLDILEEIGFECAEEDTSFTSNCMNWKLEKVVELTEILKLKEYAHLIKGNDCINCG
ncbi:MAG: S-layer homology domain-containing protein [Candidatus Gracilibacteria bacterium]|jgi:hypothetical protein|nr:S-layer homology domain-containing protein [Candidatus Gracilibacteria bacterium]